MANPHDTLAAGVFLLMAGSFGLLRHFLLEPRMPNYPKAPPFLLAVFFLFATVLIVVGLRYINAWIAGETTIPPAASPTMAFLSFMIMFYKGTMLFNVLRQRLPARLWDRLNNIQNIVRCSRH